MKNIDELKDFVEGNVTAGFIMGLEESYDTLKDFIEVKVEKGGEPVITLEELKRFNDLLIETMRNRLRSEKGSNK